MEGPWLGPGWTQKGKAYEERPSPNEEEYCRCSSHPSTCGLLARLAWPPGNTGKRVLPKPPFLLNYLKEPRGDDRGAFIREVDEVAEKLRARGHRCRHIGQPGTRLARYPSDHFIRRMFHFEQHPTFRPRVENLPSHKLNLILGGKDHGEAICVRRDNRPRSRVLDARN